MRALAALLAVLFVAPLALAQSGARAEGLAAEVELADALDPQIHVVLIAGDARDVVLPDGRSVTLAAGERASYTLPIERPSSRIVVALREETLPRDVDAVLLFPPDGWGGMVSEGAIVFAQQMRQESIIVGDTTIHSVGQGEQAPEEAEYLAKGVAYLSTQHPGAPSEMFIVRAPAAVAGAGMVANDTAIVAEDAGVEDLAALVAELHQRYRVVEVAPTSAAWFREGEARLQTQMSLLAAGLRTATEVDETFLRARAVAEPDALLTQAPAGSTLARQKGLVVVRALDAELRNATGGRVGLADVLARIDPFTGRLDSVGIEEQAVDLAGPVLATFFQRFVYGSEWPETPGARDAADVFVLSLAMHPPRAAAGEQVIASYEVVNRGTKPSDLDLVLRLDDALVHTVPIRLEIGARASGSVPVVAGEPGEHDVAFGAVHASLRVLGPGSLSLVRASTSPAEPREGEPFTLLVYIENAGELPARGRVEVYENERLVQRTTEALVEGGALDALTLPMRIEDAGLHVLDIRLDGDRASGRIEHEVAVQLTGPPREEAPLGAWIALGGGALALALAGRGRRTAP